MKTLSMQRPLPSMLIVTSGRLSTPVKSSLVNWLPPLSRGQALVGVEDLRTTKASERFLERLDAEIGAERVRQPPGQYRTTVPVHDRDQIHEPLGHRDIGDIRAPNLVDPIDRQPIEQIRIDLVRGRRLARVWPLIDRHQPDQPH